ncbi:hypothetical protein [Mesorhizobium sp. B2-4-7]|uniref:hypothetical protein n=1 Tax=Mesorhizobium sp. B2-4-7 TaxID=2589942 RepID=UPI00112795C4|nr:hypothetical protein [Mesorhizobium sp. B2-4-7]TPL30174.1 hypothetical protein FJ946_02595 [Mesorhizobium sp. B2-4-7]
MAGFSKRLAEVASGTENDLSRVLKANNVQLRDQEGRLRSNTAVLGDYANLVKNARDEQDKLRLTTLAFGDRGGDLVNMLRGGSDALESMSRQAENLGQVLSSEAIAKADELDKKFDAVANTVETKFKEALVGTADWIDENVTAAGRLLAKWEQFSKIPAPAWIGGIFMTPGASANPAARAGDLVGSLAGNSDPNAAAKGGRLYQSLSDDAFNSRFSGNQKAAETVIPPAPKSGGSKSNRPTADDRVQQEIQAVKDRTAALLQEQQALGLSFKEQQQRKIALDLEQQALKDVREEARRKGDQDWQNAQLSAKQVADINAVSEAYAEQADHLRTASQTQQLQRDLLQGAFGDLRSALQDGKLDWQDLGDIAMNALDKIVDKIENDLIDAIMQANSAAGGGGGGLLGTILGGVGKLFGGGTGGGGIPWSEDTFRAGGGPVTAGQPYIVGEKRPELFVPDRSGVIIPKVPDMDRFAGAPAGASQSFGFTFAPQLSMDKKEDVPAVLDQLRKFLDKEFMPRTVKAIQQAKPLGLLK